MTRIIQTPIGPFERRAWTGGDGPPQDFEFLTSTTHCLYRFFLEEFIAECGGLGLWECAGTSANERLEMFKRWARCDAWATWRERFPS